MIMMKKGRFDEKKNVIEQKKRKMEKKPCARVDRYECQRLESDKVNPSTHSRE